MGNDFYTVTVDPAVQPVTLDEAKLWCKVTHTVDNALITALIVAATQKAELFTNRIFIERTIQGEFAGFECSQHEKGYFIELRRSPVQSVTSVKVYIDDVLTTISADEYNLKSVHGFSRIVFEEVNDNPDYIPYPYQVVFVAGYGLAVAVLEPVKLAIKEAVCYWYQNRGDCACGDELPGTAKAILREYRILNTFG